MESKKKSITVEPVRDLKAIKTISKLLAGKPRDLLLWTMGINNGLRASDLLRVKVSDVENLKPGDTLPITESKTGKPNILVINNVTHKALVKYLQSVPSLSSGDYLFKSRKKGKALGSQAVGVLVKGWCAAVNLKGNYGAHTLRKTWGYHQRATHGVGFEIICKRYNHSSPAITMRYLGIQDKEVHGVLMNEIG